MMNPRQPARQFPLSPVPLEGGFAAALPGRGEGGAPFIKSIINILRSEPIHTPHLALALPAFDTSPLTTGEESWRFAAGEDRPHGL